MNKGSNLKQRPDGRLGGKERGKREKDGNGEGIYNLEEV